MNISPCYDVLSWVRKTYPDSYSFLMSYFGERGGIYLVGGAVRDFFRKENPVDLDVTIDGITSSDLKAVPGIKTITFTPDSVGGHAYRDGIVIDMWPLQETYGLREFNLPVSIEGVLKRAPLNIDKIAIEIHSGLMYEDGGLDAIAAREISYCPARPFMEEIQAARIILAQHKTGYRLTASARKHVRKIGRALNPEIEEAISREVKKKYPQLVEMVLERLRRES